MSKIIDVQFQALPTVEEAQAGNILRFPDGTLVRVVEGTGQPISGGSWFIGTIGGEWRTNYPSANFMLAGASSGNPSALFLVSIESSYGLTPDLIGKLEVVEQRLLAEVEQFSRGENGPWDKFSSALWSKEVSRRLQARAPVVRVQPDDPDL